MRPLPQNHAQGKGQNHVLEKLFFEFIVAEEKKKNKGCKM